MPVNGLTWLVVLQLLGALLQHWLLPTLPGPIIGLLLLFIWLLFYGRLPKSLEAAASPLLQYLPLLLVVPCVGLMNNLDTLQSQWLVIAGSLFGAMLITIPLSGWLMQWLIRRQQQKRGRHD
ncbi:CidA/LrgA family protein [Shewanella sp.]|uniref:CidA/LrgA family protein n=1 Tax=Shewanella sp. TaxID=50422 RepID=UPI003D143BA0